MREAGLQGPRAGPVVASPLCVPGTRFHAPLAARSRARAPGALCTWRGRARRIRARRARLESFALLARGRPFVVAPDFSREQTRRHSAAGNEILAANCSRGRCPSGKAIEGGSIGTAQGRGAGRRPQRLPRRGLRGGRGRATGGGVCELTFGAACGRGAAVSRCPTFARGRWRPLRRRVRLRGLLIRAGTRHPGAPRRRWNDAAACAACEWATVCKLGPRSSHAALERALGPLARTRGA